MQPLEPLQPLQPLLNHAKCECVPWARYTKWLMWRHLSPGEQWRRQQPEPQRGVWVHQEEEEEEEDQEMELQKLRQKQVTQRWC
ncbi:hypothetical protein AWZ03_013890 [Drosophila navojoa]|uniref:Uncharacterized protein n=1 Tax=Drosophila navojoa TaxID=7232 RepID=A0A484ASV8_DRONA|nr:hypothetical protein AWZ03_013890 [Drosophila navojoa]